MIRTETFSPLPLFEDARTQALAFVPQGGTLRVTPITGALRILGDDVCTNLGLGLPKVLRIHRDHARPLHKDSLKPYPCLAVIVYFRRNADGGILRIGEQEFPCNDRDIIVFDAQNMEHEVTEARRVDPGGHRLSVTFFSPTGLHSLP